MPFKDISFLKNMKQAKLINVGFSKDEKWVIDDTYLLRISPQKSADLIVFQEKYLRKINEETSFVPKVYDAGSFQGKAYLVLDYMTGSDMEVALPHFPLAKQYALGKSVGACYRVIHQIPVDQEDQYNWKERMLKKYVNLKGRLQAIVGEDLQYLNLLSFIESQFDLLENRSVAICHHDLHPRNVLIHQEAFAGLIDWEKLTLEDPYTDFQKTEFFTVPISKCYARGLFDGYFLGQEIPTEFWLLHRFYVAMLLISSKVWAHEACPSEIAFFDERIKDVLVQWDDFTLACPKWYDVSKSASHF
ncbi:phosphotransferase family protein [Isobaculum melis]|uniref:Predicted kinase, aminoglycoside phosphotransferase (APT) family n=1 Tax=Isobaculum melis TaxID=142588 RepID=A0A1H9ST59_9LACT|nr:aminoglycoside phosphotransferase family protein [Isobaculum melis]SER88054.1 Predicted kinase, aminoglycoside phosphotransferase (APT) family [Isobaculum melis]